jgi:hypothetical protein
MFGGMVSLGVNQHRRFKMKLTCTRLAVVALLFSLYANTASAAQVVLTTIEGWSASPNVVNGRWTGQPSFGFTPKSNAYKDFLAIESQNKVSFTLKGKNFGTKQGSVQFLNSTLTPLSRVSVTIDSWKDTEVKVSVTGSYTFTSSANGWIRISIDKNPPAQSYPGASMLQVKGYAGVIKTRGYGQCTWYVAKRRLDAGKSIPTPSAYSSTTINASYVPQQYDGLTYGGKHVAIIASSPQKSIAKDGTITWTFTVSEMNALTDEKESSSTRSFAVKSGKVVVWIGSKAGKSYTADGYWR